ncbi:50S ribosomal protein L35 [Candidatus Gottesmanbacteria bacterium RIFCSPHIGHO2_01_FULL_39_10]|uniref:Large ribosomal subunit protein bL35 n=1 Tax=Candidatus Gottesmanbacteria bacterium RIFCSPHIGHO2_01_FULL_39_10 TaxID=1798375 RepID=A0A1F5ZLG3_9BACT|nr:MAG: 50S ribosomal protein L35 [Candidatus Gottesmanbacteria bacterium RIFCSPHIGHO2_01_FULL_39_10]
MPKVKTRQIVAKRFKITSSGKVIKRAQGSRHLRAKKSKKQIRRYNEPHVLGPKQAKLIKRLLHH